MSDQYSDVWVHLQYYDNSLTRESLELISAGRKVADKLSQRLVGIIVGHNLQDVAKQAISYGADSVIKADSEQFSVYFNMLYIDVLTEMARNYKPYAFLFVANEQGKDIAARIAFRLNTGLATDNIELDVGEFFNPALKQNYKDLLIQIRPDFGTRVAKIYTPRHRPQMATIRPGNFPPPQKDDTRKGEIINFEYTNKKEYRARIKEVRELPRKVNPLQDANVVISLGLGILRDKQGRKKDPREAYELAVRLRDLFRKMGKRAEIGASRALIYARVKELEGLITEENQVGQTGTTVRPDLYIALGISGALQHRVGMQNSKKILSVNIDKDAPIMKISHYPIVGDLYEYLPLLVKKMEERIIAVRV